MEHLQYPVGRFAAPAEYTEALRAELIGAIESFPERLRAALAGMTDAELAKPYRPGGWSKRQVVHHLADSHLNCYSRFKFALTESNPTIKPYDENAWAGLVDGSSGPLEPSLKMIDGIHARWVAMMRAIPAEGWTREFFHPVNGPTSLNKALAMYEWHARHHLAHLRLPA
jgi:hypothetical protein